MKITFSNPRLHAVFTDWPLGGSRRGQCVFNIEHHPKRGYRVTRTTTFPEDELHPELLRLIEEAQGAQCT